MQTNSHKSTILRRTEIENRGNMRNREKFLIYLEKDARKRDAEERKRIADFVETKLESFLRLYIDKGFAGLDKETRPDYYTLARRKVFSNPTIKAINKTEGEMYTFALKLYAEFLSSKTFRGKEKVQLSSKEKANKTAKRNLLTTHCNISPNTPDPLDPNDDDLMTEGKIRQVSLTKHERNRELRQACLRHYGYVCQVCGMDFERFYGETGKEFIEVHHLDPIADTDGEHVLDPKTGLVPLCSNCHSMIHRNPTGKPYTLEEMRRLYRGPKWQDITTENK